MTTPAFSPITSSFNTIRYYTQFDPYYYTVDNRPLGDIANNSTTLSKGVDAARLCVLRKSLGDSVVMQSVNGTASDIFIGLTPTAPSNLTIRIDVGAVYTPLSISGALAQVAMKAGILQSQTDLSFDTAGLIAGQSKVYTVEYRYRDVSASTSTAFFVDTGNSVQFDTSFDGVLEVHLIQGNAATTGSETAAATTSGWAPLYNFHVSYGATSWYKLYCHPSAPKIIKGQGLKKELALKIPNTGGGTASTTLDPIAAFQLVEGSDQSLIGTFLIDAETINPVKDITFELYYTSTTNTGNFAMQLSYAAVAANTSLSALSFTTNAVEAVASPSTANYLVDADLTGKIPGNALAGAKFVVVKISRLSSTQVATDTSTGNMLVTGLVAKQV